MATPTITSMQHTFDVVNSTIDDYFKDPSQWNYQDYIDEINAIANRGYTLAFHDGRLTDLAHDYESTGSTSLYEYAGRVVGYQDQDLIFEAKNFNLSNSFLDYPSI